MYLAMLPGSPRAGTTIRFGMSHVGSKATRLYGSWTPNGYLFFVVTWNTRTTPAILLLLVVARWNYSLLEPGSRKLLLEPGLLLLVQRTLPTLTVVRDLYRLESRC